MTDRNWTSTVTFLDTRVIWPAEVTAVDTRDQQLTQALREATYWVARGLSSKAEVHITDRSKINPQTFLVTLVNPEQGTVRVDTL